MSDKPSPKTARPATGASGLATGALTVAVLVLGVLLIGSLAFAPVRAVASQVLGIFRVQRLQTVSISQADLERVGKVLSEGNGSISLDSLGDVDVAGTSTEPSETTLQAAQAAVDFNLLAAPGMEGTPTVVLQQAMTIKFKLHIDKVNGLLESYGSTKLFSKALDGQEFSIHMPATIVMAYPDPSAPRVGGPDTTDPDSLPLRDAALYSDPGLGLIVAQTRGPQLSVPAGVDPLEIRDVLLGLPFLPDSVRSQLASVQDWQNTMLIPNVDGATREVTVAGMPGVVMTPRDAAPPGIDTPAAEEMPVVVMWNDNGVMRAVGGTGGEARILGVAESIAR